MKFLHVISLLALLAGVVFSQKPIVPLLGNENKPILKYRNAITVGGFGEVIVAKKFLDDDDRLLTVTNFGIQYWNTKTGELIRNTTHEIVDLQKSDSVIAISPDGSKMVLTDGFNLSLNLFWGKKAKVPAKVYSLETGKQIAVLQRPENSIRRAVWTRDGKTLVTFSDFWRYGYKTEISFWDGETLELRGAITANDWNYLTDKGDKFFTTSGITKNTFGIKFEKPTAINVWDTQTGRIEKTYPLEKEKSLKNIRLTDDEKFLLAENDNHLILLNLETGTYQNFSAKDGTSVDGARMSADKRFLVAENNGKVLVWETVGNGLPKFEITPLPPVEKEKRTTDIAGYNFDGKYLAVYQMKYKKALLVMSIPIMDKTEFYDLETGKVNPDMNLFIGRRSAEFSADDKYAITRICNTGTLYSLTDAKQLFTFPLDCKSRTYETTDTQGNKQWETENYNDDIVAFHPKKNVTLVVKDGTIEIYGTNPEQRRQQIVFAPRKLKKGDKFVTMNEWQRLLGGAPANEIERRNYDPDYTTAGFLKDGDVVFASTDDSRSVFFWEVDKSLID